MQREGGKNGERDAEKKICELGTAATWESKEIIA
jgi:hypothetical protein